MIKARLGKQAIYDEATDQILQKRYADIMKKAEVAPIAQPTLNIDSVDNDNLKITILCPVKPEVELGEYKGLEVKKGRVTVAKKDIEAHFHFLCASISFLSVPGRTDHLAYILWYIFTWQ